jgi:L-serine dehydratase
VKKAGFRACFFYSVHYHYLCAQTTNNHTAMESIRNIFRIGHGPSSSHTMGPRRAAEMFLERCPDARRFRVTLFGALAATGRGHLTDKAIEEVLGVRGPVEIVWKPDVVHEFHTNGMLFQGVAEDGDGGGGDAGGSGSGSGGGGTFGDWMVFSVGGGNLA